MDLASLVPDAAVRYGFVVSSGGAHTSKTIMLRELALLLAGAPPEASYADLRRLVIEENVLLKRTLSNREEVFNRLAQLYGFRPELLLYRVLRNLWEYAEGERPLLALLCAVARDPLLRVTAPAVLEQPEGSPVAPQMLEERVQTAYPDRYNPDVLKRIGRHTISSWEQAGHLIGHRRKVRRQAVSGPASTAYALLTGHLCGARGTLLFQTFWASLLDAPAASLDGPAFAASQRGWIDYRRMGDVVEIGFSRLMQA